MTRANAADPASFVARHLRGLHRWLRTLGCPPDAADDHCQEALLAGLHHGIAAWQPERAAAWLRTAARNLFLMQLRRERRRPTQSLDDAEAAWLAAGAERDGGDAALDALRGCLGAADDRDRDLLQRRYADDEPRAVTAQALGLGEAGVKQALRRARARLRACMELRLGKRIDNAHDAEEAR